MPGSVPTGRLRHPASARCYGRIWRWSVGSYDEFRDHLRRRFAGLRELAAAERWFVVVLAVGLLLRLCALVGYYPILWYNDAFEYLGVARRWQAYPIRPDGYSACLRLLSPFHSLAFVAVVQHALGVGVAILLYALMRHFGVRRWLATLGAAPQLLDARQINIEQLLLSDSLFIFLVVLGVTLLAWRQRISMPLAVSAGLALSLASLTRTIGLPIVVLGGAYVLIRWMGWRAVAAFAATVVVLLGAYAAWFDHEHGHVAFNTADGVFLYARVAPFADCHAIHPAPNIAPLCDYRPAGHRPPGPDYIWHASPLDNISGPLTSDTTSRFTTTTNDRAMSFALAAIRAQPLDYVHASLRDFVRSFTWAQDNYPNKNEVAHYVFNDHPEQPGERVFVSGGTGLGDARAYQQGNPRTRMHRPAASFLEGYQRWLSFRGPLVLVAFLIGAVGIVWRRRRDERRLRTAFVWLAGFALLVVPDFTAQFDNRYVLPAIPLGCAAAALAVELLLTRTPSTAEQQADPEPVAATASA